MTDELRPKGRPFLFNEGAGTNPSTGFD